MAIDKAVDSSQLNADLTAVADAIRTKGGTSDALEFPDGFVSAVEAIQAGGIPANITEIAGGTYTAATNLGQAFYIPHGMGKTPTLAVIWSEATNAGGFGWALMFGGGGGFMGAKKGTNLAYADLGTAYKRGDTIDALYLKPSLASSGTSAVAGDTFHWLAWI